MRIRVRTHTNSNLHDLFPIDMMLPVFVGNWIDDILVERHADKGLFYDGTSQSNTD